MGESRARDESFSTRQRGRIQLNFSEKFIGVRASILDGLSQADRDAGRNHGWRGHKDSCESICISGTICQLKVAKSQENLRAILTCCLEVTMNFPSQIIQRFDF